MTTANAPTDELCINTIRALAMDAVQQAANGHPGTPMGVAPRWPTRSGRGFSSTTRRIHGWPDRDRFVLSAGHASIAV